MPARCSTRRSASACVFVYDVVVTLIILKVVDLVIGLRVSEEVERDGLDLALHGETVQ